MVGGSPVGLAVTVAVRAYVETFNLIGAPIHAANITINEADLRRVFGGKTPEQLKADIEALSTEPRFAAFTITKLYGETFTAESRFNTGYRIADQWAAYRKSRIGGYQSEINAVYTESRFGGVPEQKAIRSTIASALKHAAVAFVDQETAKVRAQHVRPGQ